MTAEDRMLRALKLFLIAFLVVVLVAVLVVFKATAQHTHEGATGHFYQTWMRPDNRAMSCCHDKDCAPAQSRLMGGKWQARNTDDEPWLDIPESKIERERDSPDGRSHLCKAGTFGNTFVYCFLPASGM